MLSGAGRPYFDPDTTACRDAGCTAQELPGSTTPGDSRLGSPRMTHKTGRSGMHVFIVILVGQMISMIGSQLAGFALGIDILYETHAISQFALVLLFASLPAVLLSPLAGA